MEKTNRELDTAIRNLSEKMEEKHIDLKETLERIETQTVRTNGRVSELEKWRWMIMGAVGILTALVVPLIFIILKNLKI